MSRGYIIKEVIALHDDVEKSSRTINLPPLFTLYLLELNLVEQLEAFVQGEIKRHRLILALLIPVAFIDILNFELSVSVMD